MKTIMSGMAVTLLMATAGCASTSAEGSELASAGDKEVCRRVDEMGSNLPKRICMSKAEWKVVDDATNEDARRFLDRAGSRGSGLAEPK